MRGFIIPHRWDRFINMGMPLSAILKHLRYWELAAKIRNMDANEYAKRILSGKFSFAKVEPKDEEHGFMAGSVVSFLLAPLFTLGVEVLSGRAHLRDLIVYTDLGLGNDRKVPEFLENPKKFFLEAARRFGKTKEEQNTYLALVDILFKLGEEVKNNKKLREALQKYATRQDMPGNIAEVLENYSAFKEIAETVKRLPAFREYVKFLYENGLYTDPLKPLAEELGIDVRRYEAPVGAAVIAAKVRELAQKGRVTLADVKRIAREVEAREKIVRATLDALQRWKQGEVKLPEVDVDALKTLGLWDRIKKYLPREELRKEKVSLEALRNLPPEALDELEIVGDIVRIAQAVESDKWQPVHAEHTLQKLADFYSHVKELHNSLLRDVLSTGWRIEGGNLTLPGEKYWEIARKVEAAKDRARHERPIPEI